MTSSGSNPKTGLVALIGRPNVGKSTLLNRFIGQKISIVSDKPQTTRNRILGVLTRGDSQAVFVDTPGIHRPTYRMNKRMMETVYDALKDVDLMVQMVDASVAYGKGEKYVLDLVQSTAKPTILALTKVDLISKGKLLPMIEFYNGQYEYLAIVPISAVTGDNVDVLLDEITRNLHEGEFLYPSEYITDQQERGMVAEIIREKVLVHTRGELPYSTAVQVELFDESERDEGLARIMASIIVDKQNHKKIVIGHAGQMVKTIGTEARKDIEEFLAVRKVFLGLNVKVMEDWRDREEVLDEIGVR